jgi:hypothetical protein
VYPEKHAYCIQALRGICHGLASQFHQVSGDGHNGAILAGAGGMRGSNQRVIILTDF